MSVILLASPCLSQKQSNVIIPGANSQVITKEVDVLRTSHHFSLDSILNPSFPGRFQHLTDKSILFHGWDPYYYWFRFVVKNPDTASKDYYLLMGHLAHNESEIYQKINGSWKATARSGNKFRFDQLPYPYIHHVLPITVRANSTDTFYLRYDYLVNFKTFVFVLQTPEAMQKLANDVYFDFGLILGILALFLFLNLYLYFTIKDKLHLWYAAYLVFVIFLIMRYEGLDKQFLGLDTILAQRLTPVQAIAAIGCFMQMHIIQMFLSNISKDELLYKITVFVKYNLLISGIAHIVTFSLNVDYRIQSAIFEWSNKSLNLGLIFTIIICIVSYLRKFKPALFVLLGTIVFLLGGLEKLLFLENVTYTFPPSLFEIGLVIETAILSFAMMYRYRTFMKEKEDLEAIISIQNNQVANNILLAQEAERKRIAEDLHDEIGSSLAVLKLRMQNMDINKEHLDELLTIVDKASSDTRNISHNLMPPEFEKTSLQDLLQGYYYKLNLETNTRFLFISKGHSQQFEKSTELMIYRIIIEITRNILMHSKATEATIQLIYEKTGLEIMAEDNGIGIKKSNSDGIGMKNIYSRVNYINGEISVDSGKKGTTIIINVPYKKETSI
ncbi:MAG TPA: 7TM diverse intracellular signaling domain-containing protein [Chitinophagaceae bacterium]|nr:7TM diverse intracellular signaling domain-containing protein [Chitinophagaceae bacterium]